jgi:maleate isomerase
MTADQSIPDGPRAQRGLGVVAPYDFALDRELWRWIPDEVTLLITRTPNLGLPVTLEMLEQVSDHGMIARGVRDVLACHPEAVTYLCTSGSFLDGVAAERELRRVIEHAGAPAAITPSGALLDALRALDVTRVAVATPYIESVTARLIAYLGEADVDVVATAQLGMTDQIAALRYHDVADLVRAAVTPDAEAIFVSCTNVPCFDAIGPLERELGIPVLTANQVAIWGALNAMGLPSARAAAYLDQSLWTCRA